MSSCLLNRWRIRQASSKHHPVCLFLPSVLQHPLHQARNEQKSIIILLSGRGVWTGGSLLTLISPLRFFLIGTDSQLEVTEDVGERPEARRKRSFEPATEHKHVYLHDHEIIEINVMNINELSCLQHAARNKTVCSEINLYLKHHKRQHHIKNHLI